MKKLFSEMVTGMIKFLYTQWIKEGRPENFLTGLKLPRHKIAKQEIQTLFKICQERGCPVYVDATGLFYELMKTGPFEVTVVIVDFISLMYQLNKQAGKQFLNSAEKRNDPLYIETMRKAASGYLSDEEVIDLKKKLLMRSLTSRVNEN